MSAALWLLPLWGLVGMRVLDGASESGSHRVSGGRARRKLRRQSRRKARRAARSKRRGAVNDERSPMVAQLEEDAVSMPPRSARPSPPRAARQRMSRSRARRPEMTEEEQARQAARRALAARLTAMRPLARRVATDIRERKYDYSRPALKKLQQQAGLKVDGIYGGASAGLLRAVLGEAPPRPLFKPTREVPYGG